VAQSRFPFKAAESCGEGGGTCSLTAVGRGRLHIRFWGETAVGENGNSGHHAFLTQLAEGWQPHAGVRGPVVVAVSGGGDSVALLRGLHQLLAREARSSGQRLAGQRLASQRLVVAHARHDLREGHEGDPAAADAAFVRQLAAELGLAHTERFLRVRQEVVGGEGLEAAARRLRYDFLREVAESEGARLVVTAHTADDQVETVLHRLFRGTGLAGLAGMTPVRELVEGIVLVRPMLAISAAAARDFLRAQGQAWREDATNADTRYARNLLRHDLLPRLAAGPYPAAGEAVARLADQAREAHASLEAACDALLNAYARREAGGTVVVQARPLAGCPQSLLTELVATLWRQQEWPRRDMTSRHFAAVATMLAQPAATASLDLPGGIRAWSEAGGQLRIGQIGLNP